jgi:hypothetical protein
LGIFLSAALSQKTDWNYRVVEYRLIRVKTKNEAARRVAVVDILTNLPIALNVAPDLPMEKLQTGKEYLANINVYTSKDARGVSKDFQSFFQALDVNQGIEDFIKAYWVYPGKIRFLLTDAEEP